MTGTYDLRVSASEDLCCTQLSQCLRGRQLGEGAPWSATFCPGGGITSARLVLPRPSVAYPHSCDRLDQGFLVGTNATQKKRLLICGTRYGLLS